MAFKNWAEHLKEDARAHCGLSDEEFEAHWARANKAVDEALNAPSAVAHELEALFPAHEGELSLRHKAPRASYMTVEEFLSYPGIEPQWVSSDERRKAVEANEMWEARWYPPSLGAVKMAASTLEALLEGLKALESDGGAPGLKNSPDNLNLAPGIKALED